MKKSLLFIALVLGGLLAAERFGISEDNFNDKVLEWHTMVGVAAPFLGGTNAIRGISGGGAPWVLDRAQGELSSNGDLRVRVRGLIIPQRGNSPVPFFLAEVSCISVNSIGEPINVNVLTSPDETQMIGDPADGNAVIRANVALPTPCIAPIVFVTSPTGSWFAATGLTAPTNDK